MKSVPPDFEKCMSRFGAQMAYVKLWVLLVFIAHGSLPITRMLFFDGGADETSISVHGVRDDDDIITILSIDLCQVVVINWSCYDYCI